jgi:Polyphosphate kinase 2 (PPK2)
MPDDLHTRARRIARFIKPLRVKPGSQMLSATSTPWAPWYVIPADRKWFARLCAGAVLAHTLIKINPRYPEVSHQARQELQAARRELETEAPDRPKAAK